MKHELVSPSGLAREMCNVPQDYMLFVYVNDLAKLRLQYYADFGSARSFDLAETTLIHRAAYIYLLPNERVACAVWRMRRLRAGGGFIFRAGRVGPAPNCS